MQSKTPERGLADQIRTFARERKTFTVDQLFEEIKKGGGWTRPHTYAALADFVARSEIVKIPDKRNLRQKYRYNQDFRSQNRKSPKKEKVIKAIYVSNVFTVKDVERLSGQSQNYINKILRKLKNEYVEVIGQRLCAQGRGVEHIWRVLDRNKYKMEVM